MPFSLDHLDQPSQRIDRLLVRGVLSVGAFAYYLALRLHRWGYRTGLIRSGKLPVKVISIGNLTVGGTGKTPVVQFLAAALTRQGRNVTVLSRGYKGKHRGTLVVSDGSTVQADPAAAGDEPVWLAQKLPGVPVLVNKNRLAAGQYAVAHFQPDYILLDDGYQHLKVQRDINILIVDAVNPFGNGRLLPRGILREPLTAMARAETILITKANQTDQWPQLESRLRELVPNKPLFKISYSPGLLTPISGHPPLTPQEIKGCSLCIFSGIASPVSFRRTVEQLPVTVAAQVEYPDHYRYSPTDLDHIFNVARKAQVDLIVTTEKDAVRLPAFPPTDIPVASVGLEIKMTEGTDSLLSLMLE